MQEPKVQTLLDGRMKIFDDVWSPPHLNELVLDVKNMLYMYGEVDNVDLPPTGMSTGDYLGTKIFHALWEFCEKYVPEVHGCILKRSHANIFAPREQAYYHVDDENDDAWTFMFYANNNWDINDGGETKFIINKQEKGNLEGTGDYPTIWAIPPIPGRMLIWKSNILHTATPLRNEHRFTPTFKFVKYEPDRHGKGEGAIRMGYPETYPWTKEYVPPMPQKETLHTVARIDVLETAITNVIHDKIVEEIEVCDNRIDNDPNDTHYEDLVYPSSAGCTHLQAELERTVQEYYGDDLELTGIWVHKTEPNGSTNFHNHHGSDISFVYYPRVLDNQGDLHFKLFANTESYEKTVHPSTGTMFIFPSSIPHYTGKNLSGKDRYSISGNFKRKSS